MTTICNNCKKIFPLNDKVFVCVFCNAKYEKNKDDIIDTSKTPICNECTDKCYGCCNIGCYNCMKIFCIDCNVRTCKKCYDNNGILCGCYGECYTCGKHVSRGSNGWPCIECEKWSYVIFNCRICKKCDINCK